MWEWVKIWVWWRNEWKSEYCLWRPAGCFDCFYMFWLDSTRQGTDLGDNFKRHMVQPCQTLCCGIWRHTGTSGCLATSSLSPRPGTDTWCPVGRGLQHLRQLSVKAHTEAVSRSFIPNTAFHSGFPPPRFCTVYWTRHPLCAAHISMVNPGWF